MLCRHPSISQHLLEPWKDSNIPSSPKTNVFYEIVINSTVFVLRVMQWRSADQASAKLGAPRRSRAGSSAQRHQDTWRPGALR